MYFILATGNPHKVEEVRRILEPLYIDIVPQSEICPDLEPEENGTTFAENAEIKARAIYEATGIPTIADDSGLAVDALAGAPGIYSARYAGEQGNSKKNNEKLLRELSEVPDEKRTARFICSVCVCFSEEDILHCEGSCEGAIAREYHGDNGFGYDPLFMVGERSFAELSGEEKDKVSHRGNALRKLAALLKERKENEQNVGF